MMIVTERRVSRILVVCIRNSKDVATFPSLHIYQIFQSNGLIELQSAVTSHAKNLANAPIGSSCRNALMTNLPDICRHKRTARAGVGPDRQRRIDNSYKTATWILYLTSNRKALMWMPRNCHYFTRKTSSTNLSSVRNERSH